MSSGTDKLRDPVKFLKGVGPARAELLQKLGVRSISDLLFFFPRTYEDLTDVKTISRLREGELVTVVCRVVEVDCRVSQSGTTIVGMLCEDGTGYVRAVWFNQMFVKDRYQAGQEVILSGKAKRTPLHWELAHPSIRAADAPNLGMSVLPRYRLTQGLQQVHVRRMVQSALEHALPHVREALPLRLRELHALPDIHQAIRDIHFPATLDACDAARRRFVFQEFLVLQLALAMRRHQIGSQRAATPLPCSARIDSRIRRLFPFPLTDGQDQVIAEIVEDLQRDIPMNRLLQGDVGSGKTAVAIYAMLLAVAHGRQAVLMAPTEILAQQHFDQLQRLLSNSRVRLGLWTGHVRGRTRDTLQQQVADGQLDILVGTQAIVQSGLQLPHVALVVIDEQHRFGVKMRARLKAAGVDPHYLVMTATPIPRTVAMVEFGDLEISSLRSFPPDRPPVHTYWVSDQKRSSYWEFVRSQLVAGRQAMVVTPRVEEHARAEQASVQAAFESLANGELEAFRLDLIHGQLPAAEKLAAIEQFRRGKTQVLVATSIVEVGIDVPNLTVMVIENADRYGLAQLHQLRGRVGRGAFPGYVGVFASPTNDWARQRLEAFVSTHDGFALAERDFELRGPGDLFGTQQHGLPPLRIADVHRDAAVFELARSAAQALIDEDPALALPEHAELSRQARARYGKVLDLGAVG